MKDVLTVAVSARNDLGECVLWDARNSVVRWLDIVGRRLWTFDPADRTYSSVASVRRPACMAFTSMSNQFLVGLEDGLVFAGMDRELTLEPLCEIEKEKPFTRLNDGRCDRNGNFVFGTFDEVEFKPRGAWYRYTAKGLLDRLDLPAVAIPNSLCFSLDGRTLYFSDGIKRAIQCCDYDPVSGATANLRVFAEVPEGYPDGSTVDAMDHVWNAEWGNGRVVRYRPDGTIERTIELPVSQPTCVAFGGQRLATLYITSASVGLSEAAVLQQPDAGALFAIDLDDVSGVPESMWGL